MSSETFLRQTCPRPKDLKQLFEAIRQRWPKLKYPLGKRKESGAHSDETGRLHSMSDVILETLSGGKCDEFLLDYLDGRYRRELKTKVTDGLAAQFLDPLKDLLLADPVVKVTQPANKENMEARRLIAANLLAGNVAPLLTSPKAKKGVDGHTARGKKRKNTCTGGVKVTLEPSLYDDPSTTQAALKEECSAHGVQHAGPQHGTKAAMGRALKAHHKEYHPDGYEEERRQDLGILLPEA